MWGEFDSHCQSIQDPTKYYFTYSPGAITFSKLGHRHGFTAACIVRIIWPNQFVGDMHEDAPKSIEARSSALFNKDFCYQQTHPRKPRLDVDTVVIFDKEDEDEVATVGLGVSTSVGTRTG